MPQDELQVKRNLSQKEEAKINALIKESESFVPVNLELQENSAYAGKRGYDVDKTSERVRFIDEMLGSVQNGTLTMEPEQRAFLTMQNSRYKSFMQLNDGKFSGDSKEMTLIKTQLGVLEQVLSQNVTFDDRTFLAIETQYTNVIKACTYYVNNKNPWFSTGIARKQMVQDTLERMEEEKKTFMAAKEAYLKGYFGKASISSAEKLMEAHLAAGFAHDDRKEAYDKTTAQEIEENAAWFADLKKEQFFYVFFEVLKSKNPYVTEKDAEYQFLYDVSTKLQSYDEESNEQLPPILSGMGEAHALVKQAIEKGVATMGNLSRRVAPGLYLVKRDKNGQPRNESERLKEQANNEFLDNFRAYYDAKALKKQAGDAPSEEVLSGFENARKNLWDCCIKRIENIVSRIRIPTPEEFKKNPYFMEELIFKDFALFSQLHGLSGWWSELKEEGLGDFEEAYLEQHPELDMIIDMLTDIKMVETSYNRPLHHMDAHNKLVVKGDPLLRYMNVMNDPEATDEQKEVAKQVYDESMEGIKQERDDIIEQFIEHYDRYRKYEVLTPDEKKAYRALKVICKSKTPEQVVEEQHAQEKTVSKEAAELSLILQNAMKTDHLPEYARLEEKLQSQNRNGAMSREVGSLLYLVLKKENNEPLNEEEERKQEWNKKWLECYADENKRQEKEDLMREALPRIINTEIPTPDEIKANGWAYYFEKNPVKYVELSKRITGISNLKLAEPQLFDKIVPEGSVLRERWQMLANLAMYINMYISQEYRLDEEENYDFFNKRKFDKRDDPEEKERNKNFRISTFKMFEDAYNALKKRESNIKLTEDQVNRILKKGDRSPMNLSGVDKNDEENLTFLQENNVEDAKKEANLIDKILRGVNTDEKAKDRLFDKNETTSTQYIDETNAAIEKLGVKTVTGLKHKQMLDMVHVLLNSYEKEDSAEMDSVKKDLTAISLVMEKNKNLEAQSSVIEELDVAIHIAITSCKHYLTNKNPKTKTGQQRYQAVYEIWSSLLCEQRLIMFAYTSATESRQAGHPVTLGELFGMTRENREKNVVRPREQDEVQTEDILNNIYNFGQQRNAPDLNKPSKEAELGVKVFGPGYIFVKEIKDAGLKGNAAKVKAQQILDLKKRISEFPRGQVCSADIEVFGNKIRILQKSDNTLYIIDNHKQIPVGNKTFDSINNQIEAEIVNNPEIYGERAVSELIAHYRSNNMTSGEHLRVRQAMIEYICARTHMVSNQFSNIIKSTLADFTEQLIKGEITPEEVKQRVTEVNSTGQFVNGVELAEMVELTRNRSAEQLNSMVVMQAEEVHEELPMEEGWTSQEKKVKNFVADLIFSQETWEMDASISRPDGFVADMVSKHAPAVLELLKAKKEGQSTATLVEGIMQKMSLSELDGNLNGERIKLSAVVTDAVASLTDLVETQLARFNEGGDLAAKNVEATDAARLEYLFNNQDTAVKSQLLAEMRQQLTSIKTSMDEVVNKAGDILQENVTKMTDDIFPEQEEGQEKNLEEQSLKEILSGATKSEKGQGRFIRVVLKNYFGKVSNLDKRSMLASVIRCAKKVTVDDLTDTEIIRRLKTEKPQEFGQKFKNVDQLTDEERRVIDEYRNTKKNLRMQSNFLAGLLRGAGPLMQKLMQGMPASSLPPEIAEALKDMKTDLPPIPEEIVRTRFAAMVESSGGTVTKIEKIKSLGAASVGQAFLCKVYGPGMRPEGEEVVIKLLRPEASNRMKREEAIMLECASMTDEAMKATYEGQIEGYRKELDLSVEAENCRQGKKAYKEEMDKLPENKKIKGVQTMSVFEEIPATSNALVLKKVQGDTLDGYIRELKSYSAEALERAHAGRPDVAIHISEETEQTIISVKKEILNKIDTAVKRRDHLLGLINVWITQAVCNTGFYHGDLHAGNIMINDEDATFIDYGNAVQLSKTQQENIAKMTLAATLSTVRKYKEVEETITENGKTRTVKRTVYDTEKMNKINDESVDLFFTAFNEMLSESNDEAANAAYTEEKKNQVRTIFKTILQKGGPNEAGARIAAAILKVQEIGVKIPAALQNFSQGQIRLQNSIDELNDAIDNMKSAANKLDNALINSGVKDPVYIVQNKVIDEHMVDEDNDAGAAYEHAIKEMEPLNEDEFVKAVLDNQYVEGDQELGIHPINKRKEFDQFYFRGILNLKNRYDEESTADRKEYEQIKKDARRLVTEYFNTYRDRIGTPEQLAAANELSDKLMIGLAADNLFDAFGGVAFMANGVQNALRIMDEDYLNDFLEVVETLFPIALSLQDKLDAIRKAQDGDKAAGIKTASAETLNAMAKDLYKDFAKIWNYGVKRNNIREVISFGLSAPWNSITEDNLKELLKITDNNVGARLREKMDAFFEIKNRDVKITEEGNGRDFNLSPENAPEFLRARKELLDVAMEAANIRIKKFAKEMHGKKPNFKFVNYDTVMADVVNNNRNALTGKVGFKNVMWAMKVVAFG